MMFYSNLIKSIFALTVLNLHLYASSSTTTWLDSFKDIRKSGNITNIIKPNSYRLEVAGHFDPNGDNKSVILAEVYLWHFDKTGEVENVISDPAVNLNSNEFIYNKAKPFSLKFYGYDGSMEISGYHDETKSFDLVTNLALNIEGEISFGEIRILSPKIDSMTRIKSYSQNLVLRNQTIMERLGVINEAYNSKEFKKAFSILSSIQEDGYNGGQFPSKLALIATTSEYGDARKAYENLKKTISIGYLDDINDIMRGIYDLLKVPKLIFIDQTIDQSKEGFAQCSIYKTIEEGISSSQGDNDVLSLVSGKYKMTSTIFPKPMAGKTLKIQAIFEK